MYTLEELEQECIKRYGADWKNVKIKAHADGEPGYINTSGYIEIITTSSARTWNTNGCIRYKDNWAEPLTETSELDQDIQSLKDKYPQYRFTITVEDNL